MVQSIMLWSGGRREIWFINKTNKRKFKEAETVWRMLWSNRTAYSKTLSNQKKNDIIYYIASKKLLWKDNTLRSWEE